MTPNITHILFDMGGVIVRLRGLPILEKWFDEPKQPKEVWRIWLTSEAPRQFESGNIDRHQFSQNIISELQLNTTPEQFLAHFSELPEAVYPGVKPLLSTLQQHYTTACLSNSNELHWQGMMDTMGLKSYFDWQFSSHLMGLIKPDTDSFEYVLNQMGVKPEHTLFLDDNQLNIDAAKAVGLHSECVAGFEAVVPVLQRLGITT